MLEWVWILKNKGISRDHTLNSGLFVTLQSLSMSTTVRPSKLLMTRSARLSFHVDSKFRFNDCKFCNIFFQIYIPVLGRQTSESLKEQINTHYTFTVCSRIISAPCLASHASVVGREIRQLGRQDVEAHVRHGYCLLTPVSR